MMDNNKMICYCDQVTKGEIIEAMEKEPKTLADIKRMTGACCSCKCAGIKIKREVLCTRHLHL